MYRFRSIDSVFNFNELGNQEICFSPTNEEDDIYEGQYLIYFNGDYALWKGFYYMLYEHVINNISICGTNYKNMRKMLHYLIMTKQQALCITMIKKI